MFKTEFQGGPVFELLSIRGNTPISNWKIKGCKKEFMRDIKAFGLVCELGKLVFPKDLKEAYLVQNYLVFQFLSDMNNNHRRFFLSTGTKEWNNLCIDLSDLVSYNFPSCTFRSLDNLSISGQFKLRKVFTMHYGENLVFRQMESIPGHLDFGFGIEHLTQFLNSHRLLSEEREREERVPVIPNTNSVAFGRRIDLLLPEPKGKYRIPVHLVPKKKPQGKNPLPPINKQQMRPASSQGDSESPAIIMEQILSNSRAVSRQESRSLAASRQESRSGTSSRQNTHEKTPSRQDTHEKTSSRQESRPATRSNIKVNETELQQEMQEAMRLEVQAFLQQAIKKQEQVLVSSAVGPEPPTSESEKPVQEIVDETVDESTQVEAARTQDITEDSPEDKTVERESLFERATIAPAAEMDYHLDFGDMTIQPWGDKDRREYRPYVSETDRLVYEPDSDEEFMEQPSPHTGLF
ncbi:hypothetical protein EDD86DRAFT_249247 [Gorgonomyces haynaldii]|nr:hypothetical protein EDD86DRAFT_249247 [Gorgonomyces haynaldii]